MSSNQFLCGRRSCKYSVQSWWQAAALFLYVVGNEPPALVLYMTSGHLVENV
jgi:uncharacterized protein YjiK